MIYFELNREKTEIGKAELKEGLYAALQKIGVKKRVIVVPPDITRYHSQAGILTSYVYEYFKAGLVDILPALGTHAPMSSQEIQKMYPGIPESLFRIHDWRKDIVVVGTVPGEFVESITEGALYYNWPAQLNKIIWEGNHDLILSVGQVVPHEVVGMANYNKNLFVGTGGAEAINKSHFIGAVYGMERLLGRPDNPVRELLNYASNKFILHLPVIYVLTVVALNNEGNPVVKGLFIGDDSDVFYKASELSLNVNFNMLDKPLGKVIVYLDPEEYKSLWLGNKSIYRTRMALADNGELIVLGPGLKGFGEDSEIDRLIKIYGYSGKKKILEYTEQNAELRNNLSAAAHLVHGSTEGRFNVTYCPGKLSREEIESVSFQYADLKKMIKHYNPERLKPGFNIMPDGEEIYFIQNPALGLWAYKERFYK
ncbi:MAG: DUF2088 domain-containing protein [Bacteroidales bacterium]|nr:DUF2088 domain-containing protein [Bacteroidales bacterium]